MAYNDNMTNIVMCVQHSFARFCARLISAVQLAGKHVHTALDHTSGYSCSGSDMSLFKAAAEFRVAEFCNGELDPYK